MIVETVSASVLATLLLLLSLVENSITYLSRFEIRVILERLEKPPALLPRIVEDRAAVLIPLQFSIQLSQISLAVLGTYLAISRGGPLPLLTAFLGLGACVLLLRQLIPKLIVAANPEKVLLVLLPLFEPIFTILRWAAWPVMAVLALNRDSRVLDARDQEEEPSEEEIQAFLDVGEEAGILEEHDSEMIQSVVEFGDTRVREVMTPRTEMVVVARQATLEELKSLIVASKHSRIPVYTETPEQITGVVSVRPLLAKYSTQTARTSIRELVQPVTFTPESKRVRELLKELQLAGECMAIVLNEYGEVAGLVTMEDLVEEVVGEIRDKDQPAPEPVVCEGLRRYVLRGDAGIAELNELLEVDLDTTDFTTISGWLVNHLGRVPHEDEEFDIAGLRIQILKADRRRVHSLRIEKPRDDASSEEAPAS